MSVLFLFSFGQFPRHDLVDGFGFLIINAPADHFTQGFVEFRGFLRSRRGIVVIFGRDHGIKCKAKFY